MIGEEWIFIGRRVEANHRQRRHTVFQVLRESNVKCSRYHIFASHPAVGDELSGKVVKLWLDMMIRFALQIQLIVSNIGFEEKWSSREEGGKNLVKNNLEFCLKLKNVWCGWNKCEWILSFFKLLNNSLFRPLCVIDIFAFESFKSDWHISYLSEFSSYNKEKFVMRSFCKILVKSSGLLDLNYLFKWQNTYKKDLTNWPDSLNCCEFEFFPEKRVSK